MASAPSAPATPPAGERVIRLPGGRRIHYDRLTAGQRATVDDELWEFRRIVEANPLQGFEPFPAQQEFLAGGRIKIKAAICGNRAGKTEIGVVDDLIQLVDRDCLPPWLAQYKCWEPPFLMRVVVLDLTNTLFGVMIPKWQELTPRSQLVGDAWDAAFDKTLRLLRFKNGSWVQFMSAEMDREKFSGAKLDRVHFDEEPPPPNGHEIMKENRRRLIDRRGQMTFTMTPLLGLSWTYDEIWERRDDADVHCVQWSMTDNPHLPPEEVQAEIATIRSDKERQAVIEGKFVHFRGRVLEEFDENVHVVDPPPREALRNMDVIVAYDPGLSRSGVVWLAFDSDNAMLVFDELYVKDTPLVYFEMGRDQVSGFDMPRPRAHRPEEGEVPSILELANDKNRWWGVTPLCWVIDPAARIRDMVGAKDSVMSTLLRAGVGVVPGQNDRLSGILGLKTRLVARALHVTRNCVWWLHEQKRWLVAMDDEAAELRAKGQAKGSTFTTIGPDHLMDPTRYGSAFRAWGGGSRTEAPKAKGAIIGVYVPPTGGLVLPQEPGPMGSMS